MSKRGRSKRVKRQSQSKAMQKSNRREKQAQKQVPKVAGTTVEAEALELLQRLRRDCNVQRLRDQIAEKVEDKEWRKRVLDWTEKKPSPSQLGRLRNAVLRPLRKDQEWKTAFKEFLETLDPEKWAAAETDKLNQLAEPDRFWEASEIKPPKSPEEGTEQNGERLFYWRTALTTLLLGSLRAHSRERANP